MIITKTGIHFGLAEVISMGFHIGDRIEITKYEEPINDKQKGLYFLWLSYCLEHGLKQHGHYSKDGLHDNIKQWIKEYHPMDFKEFSLKKVNTEKFSEILKVVDLEFMVEQCGIDTSIFWKNYEEGKYE